MAKKRPEAYFKDGYFVPPVPIPPNIPVADFKLRHGLKFLFIAVKNPLESFSEIQYRLPVFQYMMTGSYFTNLADPGAIKHCLVDNRNNYRMSSIRQRIVKPILGDGLVSAEGEEWSHARRVMTPMFTPRNVSTFAEAMTTTGAADIETLFGEAAQNSAPVKLAPLLSTLTYNVLSDTLFSGEIEKNKTDILQDVATTLQYMGRPDPFDLMEAPEWLPRLTTLRGLRAVRRVRKAIRDIAKQRSDKRDTGETLPDDFLSRLLLAEDDGKAAFTPKQIEDHLITFIGAGHETTARALVWMLYLLSNDTDSRDRLEAEIDTLDIAVIPPEDWVDHLPWTKACFEETMRLYPPVPILAREAIKDDQYGLAHIPERTYLLIVTWILHRHKKLWDRPDAFDPSRFLGEARGDIDRFQYLPFGAGERVCIGQRFAMQEAMILIVLLLRNFRFDYRSDTPPWPVMRITVQPENDMPMKVTRRRQAT